VPTFSDSSSQILCGNKGLYSRSETKAPKGYKQQIGLLPVMETASAQNFKPEDNKQRANKSGDIS